MRLRVEVENSVNLRSVPKCSTSLLVEFVRLDGPSLCQAFDSETRFLSLYCFVAWRLDEANRRPQIRIPIGRLSSNQKIFL